MSGSIDIVLGCMFSGKTSSIISHYNRFKSIKKKAICINYKGDDRYDTKDKNLVSSHDEMKIECVKVIKLSDVDETHINNVDMILINEGQFFVDLVEFCKKWSDKHKKKIVVSGLDGDSERKSFGKILELIPHADSVTKKTALCTVCMDGTEAIFSYYKGKTKEGQIKIGGEELYIPVCREHYNILEEEAKKEKYEDEKNKDKKQEEIK